MSTEKRELNTSCDAATITIIAEHRVNDATGASSGNEDNVRFALERGIEALKYEVIRTRDELLDKLCDSFLCSDSGWVLLGRACVVDSVHLTISVGVRFKHDCAVFDVLDYVKQTLSNVLEALGAYPTS